MTTSWVFRALILLSSIRAVFGQFELTHSHGTLVVCIASSKCIVLASDSRRTGKDLATGTAMYEDTSKKVFIVSKNRVLGIAGLADVSLPAIPGLITRIAPSLDREIAYFDKIDDGRQDFFWNDPPLPDRFANLPEPSRSSWIRTWNMPSYPWWSALRGPIQTVFNIAATYRSIGKVEPLIGILAGYKKNGEAKIERLSMAPSPGISDWGRPRISVYETREAKTTTGPLIWQTVGVTGFADAVLGGSISPELIKFSEKYPSISAFLAKRQSGPVTELDIQAIVALATELIRATASLAPTVGSAPIQLATLRPNMAVQLKQPDFPSLTDSLPSEGTWNLGIVFTPNFPFDERSRGVVFTACEIKDNKVPIPLGNNYFYGNTFERATFVYTGGAVNFDNNKLVDCTLNIPSAVDVSSVQSVLRNFSRVARN